MDRPRILLEHVSELFIRHRKFEVSVRRTRVDGETCFVSDIVDKTASFVARVGPGFENRVRETEANNPKFNFLNPHDPYHAYYLHKVKECMEGKAGVAGTTEASAPAAAPTPAAPAAATAAPAAKVSTTFFHCSMNIVYFPRFSLRTKFPVISLDFSSRSSSKIRQVNMNL